MRPDALLIALVAFAWLPANHYPPWGSAWQEGLALLAVGLAAAALSRRASLPLPWAVGVALALAIVGVQTASGHILFAGDGWSAALHLAGFGLALAAGSTLVEPGAASPANRLETLCTALLVAALLSAGIGFAQWAGVQELGIFGADLAPGQRPFANFGQPNHWCTASFIGLGAAWVLFESRRFGGLAFALIAAVLVLAMVMSGSRTAWLQLAIGLGLMLLLRRRATLRLKLWPVLLMLALFVAAWLVWPLINAGAEPGTARTVTEQAQAGVRLPLWRALLEAIAERPWIGYGWQQMVLAQQAVALEGPPIRVHFDHAHNLVLDLLIWNGLPLGLALVGLAGWALWKLLAATRDARAAGLLLAIGGVIAHAMVEYAIEYAYFLLPVGLMLGAAHRMARTTAIDVAPVAVRATGAVFLLALLVTALDYLKAEQSNRMLRLESARIGTTTVESPSPELLVLTQLQAYQTYARQEPRAGASPAELDFARRASERFAYPTSQLRWARWQALNGDPVGAAQTLQLLCAMHSARVCREAVLGWAAAQSDQPALQAVPLPALPR